MASEDGRSEGWQNQLMMPPHQWRFNNLIANCVRKLGSNELEIIKHRYKGIVPDETRTWTEIFDILRTKYFLDDNNIIYLQHIIRTLERMDLLEMITEYVKETGDNVFHFREAKGKLPSGYHAMKIHVSGHNCQTQSDLNRIRQVISEILCVPIENVLIGGIEEANSIIIVIMLPSMYVNFLRDERKLQPYSRSLARLGIDRVIIDDRTFEIELEESNKEKKSNEEEEARIEKSLTYLRHEVAQKEMQIKQLEKNNLELSRKLKTVALTEERVKVGFKRKVSDPVFEHERNKFQKKTDNIEKTDILNTAMITQQFDAPESEGYTSDNEVSAMNENVLYLASTNMSVRKLIGKKSSTLQFYKTNPGEVTEKGLYDKHQRLYPTHLYSMLDQGRKKSKNDLV